MTNNDILRRLRYTFDFNDAKVISLFASGGLAVTREQIIHWMKKDDDAEYKSLHDKEFAVFLNGLINDKRGKKEGPQPEPEKELNNNIILRKLKIALNLQEDGMLEILALTGIRVSKHELSALFRNPSQPQFRPCGDQFLRNFLHGLQIKFRGEKKELE